MTPRVAPARTTSGHGKAGEKIVPRESKASRRQRGIEFCARMHERYPGVQSALDYHDPFTLVVCVMLSAQTTDAGVNRVTPELFRRWPTPQAMAQADPAEVGEVIHSIGFWRAKAAHCVELSQMIMSDFGGEVPHTMEELCRLPGVGRKTANIVLNKAFGICEGIAVDTHVFRIATRMGFTRASTPAAAEKDLLDLLPQELWTYVNEEWIHFGRDTCTAQRPKCEGCPCADICPSAFKAAKAGRRGPAKGAGKAGTKGARGGKRAADSARGKKTSERDS
ncbi:DNA-(apurinic or apyrimidinic site) lyase /endonuclease III [Parafannyhessea umbonata]|uniref:Endonuclease III n=1 Tax=Parafannyhessea umbonata TaxID=604330 RepID=A0A1H1NSW8_9ACTN|nr:DNA-(apurinic or apyrimidinic site) lyase /endonuclease III [Parafannyhessea umbonata]